MYKIYAVVYMLCIYAVVQSVEVAAVCQTRDKWKAGVHFNIKYENIFGIKNDEFVFHM